MPCRPTWCKLVWCLCLLVLLQPAVCLAQQPDLLLPGSRHVEELTPETPLEEADAAQSGWGIRFHKIPRNLLPDSPAVASVVPLLLLPATVSVAESPPAPPRAPPPLTGIVILLI